MLDRKTLNVTLEHVERRARGEATIAPAECPIDAAYLAALDAFLELAALRSGLLRLRPDWSKGGSLVATPDPLRELIDEYFAHHRRREIEMLEADLGIPADDSSKPDYLPRYSKDEAEFILSDPGWYPEDTIAAASESATVIPMRQVESRDRPHPGPKGPPAPGTGRTRR